MLMCIASDSRRCLYHYGYCILISCDSNTFQTNNTLFSWRDDSRVLSSSKSPLRTRFSCQRFHLERLAQSLLCICYKIFCSGLLTTSVKTACMLFPCTKKLYINEATVLEGTPVKLCSGSSLRLSPAGLDALAEARHTLTMVFHVGRDCLPLSGEHTHKLWLLGLKASGVSLASWPTSSSTPLQTKIDSIIHPSQSSKNVNKEQKLPVLHILGPLWE